ncbi:hypothetical protein ACOSQ2_018973 [Xanthoceras sorbifolium]
MINLDMADESNHSALEAQLVLLLAQMNEIRNNTKSWRQKTKPCALKNKELQTKVELLTTSTIPPPGFGHMRYQMNTNLMSAYALTTLTTLTSNA